MKSLPGSIAICVLLVGALLAITLWSAAVPQHLGPPPATLIDVTKIQLKAPAKVP
jgi:hypothetical protein